MSPQPSLLHTILDILTVLLDILAAVLGTLGTYWMAKRYAPTFWSGVKFAFRSLGKYLRGRGAEVEAFFIQEVRENREVPELPGTTAMGLNFLFVAFFCQLAKIAVALLAAHV